MGFSISQVSKQLNLPASTIRFYDKEGLLPFIEKRESGYRIFKGPDIEMLQIIDCLKQTGMSIKDIKQFVEWIKIGDTTLEDRYHLFEERRIAVEKQIEELHMALAVIEQKRFYYEHALSKTK